MFALMSVILLPVERAIGLPVLFFLLLPSILQLLGKPEQIVFLLTATVILAISFAISVSIAGFFLLAVLLVQPLVAHYVPATASMLLQALCIAGILIGFALLAQVTFSWSLGLYTIAVLCIGSMWGYSYRRKLRATSVDRERMMVFR